jgi:hypothetical protein
MLAISTLILALITGLGQSAPTQEPQPATVGLCSLVAQPDQYAGKTVTLTATLASSMEFRFFKDDSCAARVNPTSGKSDLVEATFSQSQYDFKSPANKKLTKLLKRKQQAQVTLTGLFTDPGHYFGHQLCCRYQLDIQRLVSVQEVSNSDPTKALHKDPKFDNGDKVVVQRKEQQ